jgi:hypothetical protein
LEEYCCAFTLLRERRHKAHAKSRFVRVLFIVRELDGAVDVDAVNKRKKEILKFGSSALHVEVATVGHTHTP